VGVLPQPCFGIYAAAPGGRSWARRVEHGPREEATADGFRNALET
jgi:hypothetical protein